MYFLMQPTFCPYTHSYIGHRRSGKPIVEPSIVNTMLSRLAKRFRGNDRSRHMPYAINEHNVIVAHPPTTAMPEGMKAA